MYSTRHAHNVIVLYQRTIHIQLYSVEQSGAQDCGARLGRRPRGRPKGEAEKEPHVVATLLGRAKKENWHL